MEKSEKSIYKKILVASLCVLAAVYVIYHIALNLRRDVQLFAVEKYTAQDIQTFTGYIFRDETVLVSYTSGIRNYRYYDGEKVAANSVVADIYRFGSEDTAEKIAQLRQQIDILKRSTSIAGTTVAEVQKQIDSLTYRISEKNAAGDTAAAGALADELLVLMAKKDLLVQGKSDYSYEISVLEAQRASLVSSLGTPSESVRTAASGYFYSETDGYESLFTLSAAEGISIERFNALVSSAPVSTTNAVGTLMTDFHWYYVCKTTVSEADGFSAGNTYDCLFTDNGYSEPIRMQIVSKQTDDAGNALLVFSTTALPRSFDMTRCQRMETVRATYSGSRIPADEVRVIDGATFVYVFDEGTARLREVGILWEENGYFIVSDSYESPAGNKVLKLNDLIIVGEKDLYDGKIID